MLEDPELHVDRTPILDYSVREALRAYPAVSLLSVPRVDLVPSLLTSDTKVLFHHLDATFFPRETKRQFPSCLYVAYSSKMQRILSAPKDSPEGSYVESLRSSGFDHLIGRSSQIERIVRQLFG